MTTQRYLWGLGGGTAIGAVLLVSSLFVTSPGSLGPVGVTVWFLMFFIVLTCGLAVGLYWLKVFLKLHATGGKRLRYAWRQAGLISGGLTAMLALSSLGQFGIRDALLIGLLLGIAELYVRFRWP